MALQILTNPRGIVDGTFAYNPRFHTPEAVALKPLAISWSSAASFSRASARKDGRRKTRPPAFCIWGNRHPALTGKLPKRLADGDAGGRVDLALAIRPGRVPHSRDADSLIWNYIPTVARVRAICARAEEADFLGFVYAYITP